MCCISLRKAERKKGSHDLIPQKTRWLPIIKVGSSPPSQEISIWFHIQVIYHHLVFKASLSHSSAPNLQSPFPSVWVILGWSQPQWCACWWTTKPASLSHENISCLDTSALHLKTRGQNLLQGGDVLAASESLKGKRQIWSWVVELQRPSWLRTHSMWVQLPCKEKKGLWVWSHRHPRSAPLSPASSISVQKIIAFQGGISNHNGQTCEVPGLNWQIFIAEEAWNLQLPLRWLL